MNRIPVTRLKVIPDTTLTQIHEATIRLLGQTGIKFYHEGALKIFKKHGAKLDKNIVYIPRRMVENAIESSPQEFKWSGRDEKHTITIENKTSLFPDETIIQRKVLDT